MATTPRREDELLQEEARREQVEQPLTSRQRVEVRKEARRLLLGILRTLQASLARGVKMDEALDRLIREENTWGE